jgi:hypothetical protein
MAHGIKTGGRAKGTPNEVTRETREVLQKIVTEELKNLHHYIEAIERPEVRAKLLIDLLPYVIPKVTSEELSSDTPTYTKIVLSDGLEIIA